MPSIKIPVQVPYGKPDEFDIWIKDSTLGERRFTNNLLWHSTYKRLNRLWYSEITLISIEDSERFFVKEGNIVKLFSQNKLFFKGRIDRVEYDTNLETRLSCWGMAILLRDNKRSTTFSSTATSTIVTTLVGSKMSIGTNENYGNVSIRIDDQDDIKSLSDIAKTIEYDWYVSHTYPYDNNIFNFTTRKGSSVPVESFTTSGSSSVNAIVTNNEKDIQKFGNHIIILGYGDGINKIKAEVFHATTSRTKLTADLSSTDTTATVADTSAFSTSGSVWIGQEKVNYSGKTATTLTGLTRGVAFMGNVVSAYAHSTGIELYDAQYTTTSPQSGSSIEINGLKIEKVNEPSIIDQDYADRLAQSILVERKNPVERIKIECISVHDVLNKVVVGDTVTITDSDSAISGNKNVVGIIAGFSESKGLFCDLEISNKKLSFVDDLETASETASKQSSFMQGATNIFAISNYENCDNTNPLSMRFFMPSETVSVNTVQLQFITKQYRIYSSSTSSESSHTHTIPSLTVNTITSQENTHEAKGVSGLTSGTPTTGGGTMVMDLTARTLLNPSSYNTSLISIGVDNTTTSTNGWDLKIENTTTSTVYFDIPNFIPGSARNRAMLVFLPETDIQGDNIRVTITNNSDAADLVDLSHTLNSFATHTHTVSGATTVTNTSQSGSSHTHSISYGISTDTFPSGSPTVRVEAGINGGTLTEVSGSPFSVSSSGTYSSDITSIIRGAGSGQWLEVKFTPQNGSNHNRMRIEANAIIQIFIQSVT